MPRPGDDVEQSELIADWDRDLAALLAEAQAAHRPTREVPLPASLSASAVLRLAADPEGLARDLARPMPRAPKPAATRGTRFHAWVEAQFGVQPLLDRSDLEGAADDDLACGSDDLAALRTAFLAGPYASRPPHRVEAPFQLVLGGRVVRGRIDAVYLLEDGQLRGRGLEDRARRRRPVAAGSLSHRLGADRRCARGVGRCGVLLRRERAGRASRGPADRR